MKDCKAQTTGRMIQPGGANGAPDGVTELFPLEQKYPFRPIDRKYKLKPDTCPFA
jgi:hypothetical protein